MNLTHKELTIIRKLIEANTSDFSEEEKQLVTRIEAEIFSLKTARLEATLHNLIKQQQNDKQNKTRRNFTQDN